MGNISSFGISIRVVASVTFPAGFDYVQFDNETDPIAFENIDVATMKMDINGNPIVWAVSNPLPVALSTLAGTPTARNMEILHNANWPRADSPPANDVITVTATYPNGTQKVMSKGAYVNGTPGSGAGTDGRLKALTQNFMFAQSS